MKNRHDKHLTQRPGELTSRDGAAACQALNAAEAHLASQAGIPNILRPALLQAETN